MKLLLLPILVVLTFAIISVLILFVLTLFIQQEQDFITLSEPQNSDTMLITCENSILGRSAVFYPEPQTYAVKNENLEWLINCLIQKESSNNPKAYNEYDPRTESIGLLQFKKLTWEHFCVKKYGLENDIWDENLQRECCEKMLNDGLHHHWKNSYKKCVD